uniref:Uncharacterized protein n=1 Tax=Oncorhynchus kisutch TaxID=8019 RepID=A0A8C7DY12_ONCKI
MHQTSNSVHVFVLHILNKVWTKLQNLPQANSLELGAFFIIILFVGESRHIPRP